MSNRKQPTLSFVQGVYGDNYRKLREETGMTVRAFADKMFIASSTISSIENETIEPTVEQVIQYQKEFNVSLDYLVGLTKTKDIDNNMITMYTGLSEEALNVIVKLSKRGSGILNDFIVKNLTMIYNDISTLYHQSADILEIKETTPLAMSDDYEKLMIDAVRYRANLTYNQVLDDYDARVYNSEEYKKSKEQGLKLTMELLEKDNRELLKRLRKGDLKNGTNRKKEE